MEDQAKEKEREKAWATHQEGTKMKLAAVDEEGDSEEVDELIDLQFARPPKEECDCESICSTYSNLLNHPKLITWEFSVLLDCRTARKPVKKIALSKKTGLPIVEKGETEQKEEEEEEEEMEPVENLGAKRNKNETAEEKRLRKLKVKEAKSVRAKEACEVGETTAEKAAEAGVQGGEEASGTRGRGSQS